MSGPVKGSFKELMNRDYLTLVGFALMSLFVVFGYQNFDSTDSKMNPLTVQNCPYTNTFVSPSQMLHHTPIIYSLDNHQVWKGQSAAGTFQKLSLPRDRVVNFRVAEGGRLQILSETQPMDFTLAELKDNETWMAIGQISEVEIGGTVYDAIEFQNQAYVAVKRLSGEKSFLRIQSRTMGSKTWTLVKEVEVDEDSVAAFGKDGNGNLFFVHTVGNKILAYRQTWESAFKPFAEYELNAPWYILPSSFIGAGVDRNSALRVFINVGNSSAAKPALDTRTFVLNFANPKKVNMIEVSDANFPNLVTTHMAVSEDGTISINGVQKSGLQKISAGNAAETFIRVSYCN